MKIIQLLSLVILTPLPIFLAYSLGRDSGREYLNQIRKDRDDAIEVAKGWQKKSAEFERLFNEAIGRKK